MYLRIHSSSARPGIDFECEIFSDIEDGPEPEVLPYKKGDDVKIAFDGYDISEDTTYTVKIRSKDDTAERRKLGITSGPSCEAKFEFKMKPCCPVGPFLLALAPRKH